MRILRGKLLLTGLAVVAMSVAAAGCGKDLPTSPQELIEELAELIPTAELTLSNATISVGGQPVNGQTIQHGFMQGANTFFQARLHEGDHPALGQTVQVKYRWPGGMGMMMNRQGVATLYDDGTHGDWQAGPKAVFGMVPGTSHWYRGFVSPNNICGKLKFFVPLDQRPDRSENQRPGEIGITLHSVTVTDLRRVHDLAFEQRLEITAVVENEFGEKSFVIHGPDGATWQVIESQGSENPPVLEFKLVTVNN